MAARVLVLADLVAAKIADAWRQYDPAFAAPSEVVRDWPDEIGVTPDQAESLLTGRKVYVFATAFGAPEMADRGDLLKRYQIIAQVVERYAAAGSAPRAWVDARVNFVEAVVYDVLRDPHAELSPFTPDPENPGEIDLVCDLDSLRKRKLFLSYATFTFTELQGVS